MIVNLIEADIKIDKFLLTLLLFGDWSVFSILMEIAHNRETNRSVNIWPEYNDLQLSEYENDEPGSGVGGAVGGQWKIKAPVIDLIDSSRV